MLKKVFLAAALFSFSACFAEALVEKQDKPTFDFSKHLHYSFQNQTDFLLPKSGPKEKIESNVWHEWKQKDGKVTLEPRFNFSYEISNKEDEPKKEETDDRDRGFRHSWGDRHRKDDPKPDFHVSYHWEWEK